MLFFVSFSSMTFRMISEVVLVLIDRSIISIHVLNSIPYSYTGWPAKMRNSYYEKEKKEKSQYSIVFTKWRFGTCMNLIYCILWLCEMYDLFES